MAPKAASKPKKPLVPIPEPEDKSTAPDLSSILADLRGNDKEAQLLAAARLHSIREYPGSQVQCCLFAIPLRVMDYCTA